MFARMRLHGGAPWLWVALAVLVAGSVASHAAERRRTKAVFSDSKDPSSLPRAATQTPMGTQPGDLIPRGSSLEAVTAPPFASPSVAPRSRRPSTDRESPDKDWLIKSVQSLEMNDDTAAKVFGVRDYAPKTGSLMPAKQDKSSFDLWTDDPSAIEDPDGSKSPDSREEESWKDLSPAAGRERALMSVANSGTRTAFESSDAERTSVLFSDTDTLELISNREMDELGSSTKNGDLVRSALNPVNPGQLLGALRRDAAGRDAVTPRDEFRALLGLEATGPASGKGLIGGAGDVVNLQPDMTRQEINPVTPRSVSGVKTTDLPSFTPSPAIEAVQSQFRPLLMEGLPSRAFAPAAVESSLAPVTELRKRVFSPTILPVPKRSF